MPVADALHWEFRPEWAAWWLMKPLDGISAQRGYGPFNATEAVWAGEVYGVPFKPGNAGVKGSDHG